MILDGRSSFDRIGNVGAAPKGDRDIGSSPAWPIGGRTEPCRLSPITTRSWTIGDEHLAQAKTLMGRVGQEK